MNTTTTQRAPKHWKNHMGQLAMPTVALLGGIVLGEALLWGGALAGLYAPIWGLLPATVLAYLSFTVMHEAGHGNIHGKQSAYKGLNEACGWISGVFLAAPFPAFKTLHNLHHAHANNPESDPDHWVAGQGALSIAARCLTIFPHYYWDFLAGPSSARPSVKSQRSKVIATMALFIALALGGVALGFAQFVFFLWVIPAILACGVLAFVFDWLPHHPHQVQKRLHDTRVLLGPGLEVLTCGQSYHLVHHMWPRIPFYRYSAAFREMRPWLESQGAAIEEVGGSKKGGAVKGGFGASPSMWMAE